MRDADAKLAALSGRVRAAEGRLALAAELRSIRGGEERREEGRYERREEGRREGPYSETFSSETLSSEETYSETELAAECARLRSERRELLRELRATTSRAAARRAEDEATIAALPRR